MTPSNTQLDKILVDFFNEAEQDVHSENFNDGRVITKAHTKAKQALRDLMLDELIKELKELADPGPWGHEIKEYGDGDSRSVIQVSEITDRITELTAQKGTK